MALINEEGVIKSFNWSHKGPDKIHVQNDYFFGSGNKNITYRELNLIGKRFILWLISYELNFDYSKIDYYYRMVKMLQILFDLPGWILLLPNAEGIRKELLKKHVIHQANAFNVELIKQNIKLSTMQAHALTSAYKKFLWAV